MKSVPNQPITQNDKKPVDKKLDTAAYSFLGGLTKFDDPCVRYENLYKTWMSGEQDKCEKLISYNANDVISTLFLDKKFKSGMMSNIESNMFFLPASHLYGNQTMFKTFTMMYSYYVLL